MIAIQVAKKDDDCISRRHVDVVSLDSLLISEIEYDFRLVAILTNQAKELLVYY